MVERFDAIIIGAGQSGGPLSTALANAGWKVAIIEERYVGGTCINDGCTPTKTMVASARVAYLAGRSGGYGVHTGPVSVDLGEVRRRKDGIVESFRAGSRNRIEQAGVDLVRGQARFTGPKTLDVRLQAGGSRQLAAEKIFINAGARPRDLQIEGAETVRYLNSSTIMELDEIPAHLMIIGGGYVALEFGQMFRRFGSQVTMIQRGSQLLTREDPDIAEAVLKILQEDGVEVLLNASTRRVAQDPKGAICLSVETPEGERILEGSHLLAAVGRAPNSDRLDLPAAGIETARDGSIRVNEFLETNVPGIYALGDINGGPAFTHISYDDFRILKTNLLEGGRASTRGRLVPYTVFIDPQLGRIGLGEGEAREQGKNVKVARLPMTGIARTIEIDQTRGFMKAVVDADTQQILGAAVLGVEGGEIMAMLEIAMLGKLAYPALRDAVFAHPTLAESLNNLFASVS